MGSLKLWQATENQSLMEQAIDHNSLEEALKRCGSTWGAAQTHGLLSGRLAIGGADSGFGWLSQVLEGTGENDAGRGECEAMLSALFESTYRQLSERMSKFEPLLPGDEDTTATRATALAHWCEGFLHGLVSASHGDVLKERLGAEPLADIIKDMLQITRAEVDVQSDEEADVEANAEIVEYLRVAAQLTYEELADLRHATEDEEVANGNDVLH